MARIFSIKTGDFTEAGGYVVGGIAANADRLDTFIDWLNQRPGRVLDVGADRPIEKGVLAKILDQLDEPPVVGNVKQIDVTGIKVDLDRLTNNGPGLRDSFHVDDNQSSRIVASMKDDVVLGRGGHDKIFGLKGDDFIDGGSRNDTIKGGRGDDELKGSGGNDKLEGGDGHDTLSGGAGSDTMTGGGGYDAFVFGAADMRGNTLDRDVINSFDKGIDEIVDLTGDLSIAAVGDIPDFDDNGTLLQNDVTGDLIFVRDVSLTAADIKRSITPPPPGADDDQGGLPGDDDDDGNTGGQTRPAAAFKLELQKVSESSDGIERLETFQLKVRNLSDIGIVNLDDLALRFAHANDLVIKNIVGATLNNGVFDITDGTVGTLRSGGEANLFQFQVSNRPRNIDIELTDFASTGFRAEDVNGNPVGTGLEGFTLGVRMIDPFANGGSAEVFMRNVGTSPIMNIEDTVFEFSDPDVTDVTSVWGARENNFEFDVIPWVGNDRATLNPGESQKLFGFTYSFTGTDRPDIGRDDFKMTSSLDDLFS
ncbi:MAG: hypothetical protein AAF318_13180 [Pseudomonadota bacterium]